MGVGVVGMTCVRVHSSAAEPRDAGAGARCRLARSAVGAAPAASLCSDGDAPGFVLTAHHIGQVFGADTNLPAVRGNVHSNAVC